MIQSRFVNPGIFTAGVHKQFFDKGRIVPACMIFDFAIHIKGSHTDQERPQGQQCQSKNTQRRTI